MELMMHAPIWWYLWLGVVLLFGMISILKRLGGSRPQHMPEQHIPGRLATSDARFVQFLDRNSEAESSDEVERAGRDQQAMADALDEVVCAGRYTMALASHNPSFSPDAPVSPFDPGGSAHLGG